MTDPKKKPPVLFCDDIITRLSTNILGDDVKLAPSEIQAIRNAFRRHEGSWEAVAQGDVQAVEQLSGLVRALGKMKSGK